MANRGGGDLLELVAPPPVPPPTVAIATRDRYLAYQGFSRRTSSTTAATAASTDSNPDIVPPEEFWQVRGIFPAIQMTRRGEPVTPEISMLDPNDPRKSRLKLVILEEFVENGDPGNTKIKIEKGQMSIVPPMGYFEREMAKTKNDLLWAFHRICNRAMAINILCILTIAIMLLFKAIMFGAFVWDWRLIERWLTESLNGKCSTLISYYCGWVKMIQTELVMPYFSEFPIHKFHYYGWMDWFKNNGVYCLMFLWSCKRIMTKFTARRRRRRERA